MKPNLRGKKQVKPLSKAEWKEIWAHYSRKPRCEGFMCGICKIMLRDIEQSVNSALRKRGKGRIK